MTATRDRQRDTQEDSSELEEWAKRSAFGTARGWPWWAAVLLAFGLSLVGGVADMHLSGSIGKVFEGAYFLGCVGAVCFVHRRSIFGPMVQPPLILAVTIPLSVLFSKGMPSSSGTMSKLLSLGVPLVTGFPVMAVTTAATVVIGGIRFLTQRKPIVDELDEDDDRPSRGDDRRRPSSGRDADRRRSGDGDRRRESEGRPRSSGSGRPDPRSSRDDSGGSRDRGRGEPWARGRSEAPERGGRSSSGRSSGSARDRDRDRDRDRGQAPRSSSRDRDRDRGRAQPPRSSSRPSRDDDRRREPPRRRDDDY